MNDFALNCSSSEVATTTKTISQCKDIPTNPHYHSDSQQLTDI